VGVGVVLPKNSKPNKYEKDIIIRIGTGGSLHYAVVREGPETR
jgi:hypothetical protein